MAYTTPSKHHYTVEEQRDRLPLYLREFYETRQLDRITIDGNEIQGYFEYSFIEEKTYVKSPERSADGTIDNLNSYATFMTPRLVIKYNYMHIEDYRTLMKLLNSKNEFVVECYDIVRDERVVHKMYHAPAEMPKIHQRYLEVLGVRDYTVELIGTNVSLDTVEIRYYDENGNLIAEATQSIDKGTEAVINYDYVAPSGYRFDGEWKDKTGAIWHNKEVVFVNADIELFAQVVDTDEYTLSFDYGNGVIPYALHTGEAINSITITKGQRIDNAITSAGIELSTGGFFDFPYGGTGSITVEDDLGEPIHPYEFEGWYWTPVPNPKTKVDGSTVFSYDINRTIYQIYKPKIYTIGIQTNTHMVTFDDMEFKYGDSVYLPTPQIEGKKFLGWYKTYEFVEGSQFVSGTTMPPYSFVLYAKWENE